MAKGIQAKLSNSMKNNQSEKKATEMAILAAPRISPSFS
jgi:hypothetical protein